MDRRAITNLTVLTSQLKVGSTKVELDQEVDLDSQPEVETTAGATMAREEGLSGD